MRVRACVRVCQMVYLPVTAEMPLWAVHRMVNEIGGADDATGAQGGWTLGAHMDRLTAHALTGAKKGGGGA